MCGDDRNVNTINFERLKLKARSLQIKLTDEKLYGMILDADRDGSGEVDLEEYMWILHLDVTCTLYSASATDPSLGPILSRGFGFRT